MIPTKQTILHDPANGVHGNCFSAVLASLLHVDISTVPVFTDPKSWQRQVNDWLRPFGVAFMQLSGVPDACGELAIMGMHHEKCGNTQRSNEVLHSVVAVDGEAIFDPHPDASGLVNEVTCGVFLSLEPWRVATLERELSEAKEREARAAEQMTKWQNLYLQACNIRSGPHNFSDSRHWLNDALHAIDGGTYDPRIAGEK